MTSKKPDPKKRKPDDPASAVARPRKPAPKGPAGKRATKKAPVKPVAAPAKRSVSGKTKNGNPKRKDHADTTTPAPTLPDGETTEQHIRLGLELGLTVREITFIEVYLTCYNATRAYMEVNGQQNYGSASKVASDILRKDAARQYLSARMKAMFERTEAAQDSLIATYTQLAYGDMNELVEHRRQACRHCHGIDHLYQYTPEELKQARVQFASDLPAWKKLNPGMPEPEFDEQGGVGFSPNVDPHPDCPECHGNGRTHVYFHDTRYLSPAARAMYEGTEITKDGIKVRATRDGAREKLAKILKLYEDSTRVNLTVATNEELDAIYARAMEDMKAKAEAAKGRDLGD